MIGKINFTQGNTRKNIIQMFLPLCVAMTLTMIYSIVDSLWVGNLLGERGMSALTAGTAIVLILNSLSMGMGNGVSVMISQLIGAREHKKIAGVSATIVLTSTVLSIIMSVVCELLIRPLLTVMGTPEEIFSSAIRYLAIYLIGNCALFVYMQFTSIFRAFGDSVFQMKGMLITTIFNAIADPFLIKLWGLEGAAIATVISECLCLLYAIFYYWKKRMFKMCFREMKKEYVLQMFQLGIPTTIQGIMPALSSAIMVTLVMPFGLEAMAGYGVARNLELIMFMPTNAMTMTITTIVGQCAGAKEWGLAKHYYKECMAIGGGLVAILSTLIIALVAPLTSLFGQGAVIAEIVSAFFRIISVGYVLYMLTSCVQGYLTGAGKPGCSMILMIFYYLIIRVPSALLFQTRFGLTGIWLGFLVSHILAAIIGFIMLKTCIAKQEDLPTIHA